MTTTIHPKLIDMTRDAFLGQYALGHTYDDAARAAIEALRPLMEEIAMQCYLNGTAGNAGQLTMKGAVARILAAKPKVKP